MVGGRGLKLGARLVTVGKTSRPTSYLLPPVFVIDCAALMAHQYIFTMQNLRKVVPPQREILKGIYLSFYPGAKIGVLGLNGAGKSTLLKIMAGIDKDFAGDAAPAEGTRIGYLSQDPRLDTTKDVARQRRSRGCEDEGAPQAVRRAEREDGRGALRRGKRKDHGRISARSGRDRGDERVGARPPARDRDGRAAAAGSRRRRHEDLRRRAAPRRALQDPARTARPSPAGRAHEPPRRGIRRLAGAAPGRVSGDRRRRDARPILPRQRRRMDPGARPRRRDPLGGQLLELARAEGAPARDGGEAGVGEAADPASASSNG